MRFTLSFLGVTDIHVLLHLEVWGFRFGSMAVEGFRFRSLPLGLGLSFEGLECNGSRISFQASLRHLGAERKDQTRVRGDFL